MLKHHHPTIIEEMQQAQGVSDRPVIAGLSPAGKFSLYINHRPQPSAVKPFLRLIVR